MQRVCVILLHFSPHLVCVGPLQVRMFLEQDGLSSHLSEKRNLFGFRAQLPQRPEIYLLTNYAAAYSTWLLQVSCVSLVYLLYASSEKNATCPQDAIRTWMVGAVKGHILAIVTTSLIYDLPWSQKPLWHDITHWFVNCHFDASGLAFWRAPSLYFLKP